MNGKSLAFILFVANLTVWLAAGWRNPGIAAENGWLESFQVLCLFSGALIFAFVSFSAEDGSSRLMFAGLTLFYVNLVLREINVRNSELPSTLIYFLGGAGRNLLLAAGWMILFVLFLRRLNAMPRVIFSWLRSAPGLFLITGVVFYAAGVPFDKKMFGFSIETHEFFEEITEAQAALTMLISASFSLAANRRQD